MSLTIHNRAGGMFTANKRDEKDVTVKVTDPDGKTKLVNGFFTEVGSLVNGFELDPDAEFEYEYARPEIRLTLLGFSGSLKAVEAWLSTINGPQTVLKQSYAEPVMVLSGEALQIVGPAY